MKLIIRISLKFLKLLFDIFDDFFCNFPLHAKEIDIGAISWLSDFESYLISNNVLIISKHFVILLFIHSN